MIGADSPQLRPPTSPLSWAAFLASSWTWCIGMFLPVLLVRDFGLIGFFIFAVPNCLGAAAMGFVLRDAAASRSLVQRHPLAMRAFSIVTIAFHVFFLAWLGSTLSITSLAASGASAPAHLDATVLFAIATAVSVLVALLPGRAQGLLAGGLWLMVAGVLTLWLTGSASSVRLSLGLAAPMPVLSAPLGNTPPMLPVTDAMWLAPVCVFGFALCPYLDLTFHRARQSTSPTGGRAAFSVGFLVFFATMIVFTLAYAGALLAGSHAAIALVFMHMAIQAGYTVGVHIDALRRSSEYVPSASQAALRNTAPGLITSVLIAWLAGVVVLAAAGSFLAAAPIGTRGLGETVYRCFMAFYGLVFPAYVWLFMIPNRGQHTPMSTRNLAVFIAAVLIASPMFWLGFNEWKTWWLAPGLAVVLLSRLAITPAITFQSQTR